MSHACVSQPLLSGAAPEDTAGRDPTRGATSPRKRHRSSRERLLSNDPTLRDEIIAAIEAGEDDSTIKKHLRCRITCVRKVREQYALVQFEADNDASRADQREAREHIRQRDEQERVRRAELKARADAILRASGIDPERDRAFLQGRLTGEALEKVGNYIPGDFAGKSLSPAKVRLIVEHLRRTDLRLHREQRAAAGLPTEQRGE